MNSRIVAVLRKEIREILRDPYTLGIALVFSQVRCYLGSRINSLLRKEIDRVPCAP